MPQPAPTGVPIDPTDPAEEPSSAPPPSLAQPVDEQLPAERSKFSRWLASFGLGETQIPLLRPHKPHRSEGR
jgi:hypothetical protein